MTTARVLGQKIVSEKTVGLLLRVGRICARAKEMVLLPKKIHDQGQDDAEDNASA